MKKTPKEHKQKTYLGIDPGVTGAIGIISSDAPPEILDFKDENTLEKLKEISKKYETYAVIEKWGLRPGQGLKTTSKYMRNYGQWIGRLEALGIKLVTIHPKTWQKQFEHLVLSGTVRIPVRTRKVFKDDLDKLMGVKTEIELETTPKNISLAIANYLFPELKEKLKLQKYHNRADAILISKYCEKNVDKLNFLDYLGAHNMKKIKI